MDEVKGEQERPRMASDMATRASLIFIMSCLVALVAVPWTIDLWQRPLNADLQRLAAPGRGMVTEVHLSLAQQSLAVHEYFESGNREALAAFEEAERREQEAYAGLDSIARGLGATTTHWLDSLRLVERIWHAAVERSIADRESGVRLVRDERMEAMYRDMVHTAAELDWAIDRASRERRTRIARAARVQRRLETLLAFITFVAVATTWRIGRRVREYAEVAEERRRQAEELMYSKARLMRGMSHDLKNPLNLIGGHAQLIEEGIRGPVTEEQRDSLQRIQRATKAMLAMIEDLLQLARAETGQLLVRLREVSMPELLREMADGHRPIAASAGLTLTLTLSPEVDTITTDPARVRQVLGNLLSNAIKYTPSGGRVELRAAVEGGRLAIEVADTGPGIPADKREEVFAEFTRLHPTERSGAGLGLAIARRVARLLGGDISVTREPAAGACFIFTLPLAPTSELTPAGARGDVSPPSARPGSAVR